MEERSLSIIQIFQPPKDFPSDVYKWMMKNATPKMALKLMKICKYFQGKNGFPYLVVKNVESCGNIWNYWSLDGKQHSYEKIEDISKKFWITEMVDLVISPNVASTLLLKTVVCNIRKIKLCCQSITFNEFKMLTDGGAVEECDMMKTKIFKDSGEFVSFKDITDCLPNARKMILSGNLTFRSLLKTKIPSTLEHLTFWISRNPFDLGKFAYFMMKHQKIYYTFWFCGFSSEEFSGRYGAELDDILDNWSPKNEPPHFCVSNQSESFHAMIKQFSLA